MDDAKLLRAVAALSTLSFVASLYAIASERRSESTVRAPAPASASSGVDQQLRDEITRLRADLDAVRGQLLVSMDRRLDDLEARQGGAPAASSGGAAGSGAASAHAPPARPVLRYARFVAPSNAVRVQQADDGSISVSNTDANMTGKTLIVEAVRADGTTDHVAILVPAPAK